MIKTNLHKAEVYKVDELYGEEVHVVGETRRVAMHHLGQLLKHGVPLGVGELPCGKLYQGYPQRPNIASAKYLSIY